jgi:hypothetical protein
MKRQIFSTVTVALVVAAGMLLPTAAQANTQAPAASADLWHGCGFRSDDDKIVRTFERYRARAEGHFMRGGKSNLLCGNKNFGYRHIKVRHRQEWEQAALLTRTNWRDVADFSIETVLGDPDKVTYKNKKFCFSRLVYLVNKQTGRIVDTRTPNIVVSEGNKRVITAFPSRFHCK